MFKCPHCNKEIERINYAEDRRSYGNCDLILYGSPGRIDAENFNENDTESNGNVSYSCPECDNNFEIEDIIITEEEEEEISSHSSSILENGARSNASSVIFSNEFEAFSLSSCPSCDWEGIRSEECPDCGKLILPSTPAVRIPA